MYKNKKVVKMAEGEYWWGGSGEDGVQNPFCAESTYRKDFGTDASNQLMPLYMSNKGRYIWCDGIFKIDIAGGEITIESDGEISVVCAGKTLREAYLAAVSAHFPFEKKQLPEAFFKTAQYNTWMEYQYDPTQEKVLDYAHAIVDNGFEPGIMIIDEGWQRGYGEWRFDREKFPDAKAMIKELHDLGFVVMLWLCPYVTMSGREFVFNWMKLRDSEERFLRIGNQWNDIAVIHWWNGYSAVLDFTKECDAKYLDSQLQTLMRDYGVDGFKFDGGGLHSYNNTSVRNGRLPEDKHSTELNTAWNEFAKRYTYHECKQTWKGGGGAVIHRLQDKNHSWDKNGINTLIPNTVLMGLIGHPYICPDMIGGGEWTYNVKEGFSVDEELFIRMAQVSALCPMMQFSWAPWRALSERGLEIVRRAAKLHVRLSEEICALVNKCSERGEPVVRCMEYEYPGCGYEEIQDQFMLGSDILAAPVVKKGEVTKKVAFPKGRWIDEDGKIYEGGKTYEVAAPIDVLPWFRKVKD